MTDKQRHLYEYIKKRYDAYLADKKKCDLVLFVFDEDDVEVLKSVGIKCSGILMRTEVPAVLKAFEKIREISLF